MRDTRLDYEFSETSMREHWQSVGESARRTPKRQECMTMQGSSSPLRSRGHRAIGDVRLSPGTLTSSVSRQIRRALPPATLE
ncbi:MAG: DUF3734 domain-containing protein [Xanthobacteraceae bacterium]